MNRILRFFIILFCELAIAALIALLRYSNWSFVNLSDGLFIIGIILFFMSLIMYLGAYKVFSGFNYVTRTFFSKNYKDQYPKYSDYVEQKDVKEKSPMWLDMVIISAMLIIVSFILGSVLS